MHEAVVADQSWNDPSICIQLHTQAKQKMCIMFIMDYFHRAAEHPI